jgi:hypothetical protein
MTWLRETPYSLHYYLIVETRTGIQGNDLGHSKNVKDWAIRRRVPKAAMIGYGTVSETAKASVFNEGLISLRMLKVQSSLSGNRKEPLGADLHTPTKHNLFGCLYYFLKNTILI